VLCETIVSKRLYANTANRLPVGTASNEEFVSSLSKQLFHTTPRYLEKSSSSLYRYDKVRPWMGDEYHLLSNTFAKICLME